MASVKTVAASCQLVAYRGESATSWQLVATASLMKGKPRAEQSFCRNPNELEVHSTICGQFLENVFPKRQRSFADDRRSLRVGSSQLTTAKTPESRDQMTTVRLNAGLASDVTSRERDRERCLAQRLPCEAPPPLGGRFLARRGRSIREAGRPLSLRAGGKLTHGRSDSCWFFHARPETKS